MSVKIVVVGDADAGKTVLLITYVSGYPEEYIPNGTLLFCIFVFNTQVFENFNNSVMVDGKVHLVALWDTAGQVHIRYCQRFLTPKGGLRYDEAA